MAPVLVCCVLDPLFRTVQRTTPSSRSGDPNTALLLVLGSRDGSGTGRRLHNKDVELRVGDRRQRASRQVVNASAT
jgi:hypothetical protein